MPVMLKKHKQLSFLLILALITSVYCSCPLKKEHQAGRRAVHCAHTVSLCQKVNFELLHVCAFDTIGCRSSYPHPANVARFVCHTCFAMFTWGFSNTVPQ